MLYPIRPGSDTPSVWNFSSGSPDVISQENQRWLPKIWFVFSGYCSTYPLIPTLVLIRGCLHDTRATFAPERVHSCSLSWLYICLHDTTTKCHAGASHPGVSSPRFLYRGENFTLVRNLAAVSCKRETTTRFGVKSVCR